MKKDVICNIKKRMKLFNKTIFYFLYMFIMVGSIYFVFRCFQNKNEIINDFGNWLQFGESMGSIIGLFSLFLLGFQIIAEHEKNRRESAVNALFLWNEKLTDDMAAIRKIVQDLDEKQCRKIINYSDFSVDKDTFKALKMIFPDIKKKKVNNQYNIPQEYAIKIRSTIIKYLNNMEFLLVGWKEGIFDEDIIVEQFYFLIDKEKGKNMLEDFRNAAGGEKTYPAIELFCLYLENMKRKQIQHKGPIV